VAPHIELLEARHGRENFDLRRDRLGQDHAAAEDLPGTGARRARPDRPHPAAPHRRPRHGERIAEELKIALGDVVGYKVRFTDRSAATATSS
jgi:hypothetical protein